MNSTEKNLLAEMTNKLESFKADVEEMKSTIESILNNGENEGYGRGLVEVQIELNDLMSLAKKIADNVNCLAL